jgi:ketosteroid isomerase-like protein
MNHISNSRLSSGEWLRARSILAILVAVIGSFAAVASASAEKDGERSLLAAHEQRRVATLAGNGKAMGAIMLDDLTFTHANGVVESKAQFVEALESRRYQYKTLADEKTQVRVHGDTGVVSGICRIVVTVGGDDIDIRVVFTELWVETAGVWRMALWHATIAP